MYTLNDNFKKRNWFHSKGGYKTHINVLHLMGLFFK